MSARDKMKALEAQTGFSAWPAYGAGLLAILLLVGLIGGAMMYGKWLIVNPPSKFRHLILVRDTADTTPEMARLVCALRTKQMQGYLDDQGHLVDVLPVTAVLPDGGKATLLAKYGEDLAKVKLPALLVLDRKDEKVLDKVTVDPAKGIEAICKFFPGESPKFRDMEPAADDPNFTANVFVDCSFEEQPEYVPGDQTEKDKELLKGTSFHAEVFEEAVPVLPRASWKGYIEAVDKDGGGLDAAVVTILNQKQEGSCVANAATQSNMIVQCLQYGRMRVVHLSPISLYKRIGSSPMSGANVGDGLDEMLRRGILPLDTDENKARFQHTMPATGFHSKFPDGWEKTAKNFRGVEFFEIRSVEGFITALLRGYPVVYGRSGHCICATRAVYRNGALYVKYANSWGEWGDGGFGYDSEGMVQSGSRWAYALRSVVEPSDLKLGAVSPVPLTLLDVHSQPAEAEYALAP